MGNVKDFDTAVPKLLSWYPEKGREALAQGYVDQLDEAIRSKKLNPRRWIIFVKCLKALCGRFGIVPAGFRMDIKIPANETPKSYSATADIYSIPYQNRVVALKALRLHVDSLDRVTKLFQQDAVAWRCLDHPNLAPIFGIANLRQACIVGLWFPEGHVVAYLTTHGSTNRLQLMRHIVDGVQYLHSLEMIHGGLKPSNVLVEVVKGKPTVRLTDYGLAPLLHSTGTLQSTGSTSGSVRWMAPELLELSSAATSTTSLGPASDIYSVALVFWEMFSGKPLFAELKNDFAIMTKVRDGLRPERPTNLEETSPIWRWMKDAWNKDPGVRKSLDVLIREGLSRTKTSTPKPIKEPKLTLKLTQAPFTVPEQARDHTALSQMTPSAPTPLASEPRPRFASLSTSPAAGSARTVGIRSAQSSTLASRHSVAVPSSSFISTAPLQPVKEIQPRTVRSNPSTIEKKDIEVQPPAPQQSKSMRPTPESGKDKNAHCCIIQ